MDNYILQVQGVKKSFGATQALKGVDLNVRAGEVHAIVGSNGAGKSTLMKILAGIYKPDDGTIIYSGEDITNLTPIEMQQKGIQVVHQVLNIVDSMTVRENIMLSRPPVKSGMLRWDDSTEEVEAVLKLIDFPLDLKMPAGKLSVAQQQFLVLARAVINKTRILILDEPTARLGIEETNKLFAFIRKLKEQGTTILYISHRMEEIYKISDRISVFRDGLCASTKKVEDFPEDELVACMLGKTMDRFFPKNDSEIGDEVLHVAGLKYGDRLNGVDFSVRKGEIVSLVGAVGAGKTEILDILFGLLDADDGKIDFLGSPIPKKNSPIRSIRGGIALIPEDRAHQGMIADFNVKQNISSVDMSLATNKGVFSVLKENRLAQKMIEKLDVKPNDINYSMQGLSGGNQQKVVFGKWMTDSYQIYLMDEVTAGVDIEAKAEMYKLMGLLVQNGSSVLLATGDIEEALGISDRILVIYKGKVFKELSPKETTKDQLLRYIMGGNADERRTCQA